MHPAVRNPAGQVRPGGHISVVDTDELLLPNADGFFLEDGGEEKARKIMAFFLGRPCVSDDMLKAYGRLGRAAGHTAGVSRWDPVPTAHRVGIPTPRDRGDGQDQLF